MGNATELDKDLVAGLKAAKSKRAYFAMVLKGSNDGALIVSKTKVPPPEIAAAKKKCGGSAVVKGFCLFEEGKYIFETAKEAPTTAANAVKIIAKRDAALTLMPVFRVSSDPELVADEAPAADSASSQQQPKQDNGLDVVKRFHAMAADVQAALAGPNKDRVKELNTTIRDQLKEKEYAAASKNIDSLVPLLKPASDSSAPGGPKADGLAVVKRFHGMAADVQAAKGGPNKDRVTALDTTIRDQLKEKQYADASKNIDALAPLLKSASGASPKPPAGLANKLTARLTEMSPEIKAAMAGPNQAAVKALLTSINKKVEDKEYMQAIADLRSLEQLLEKSAAQDAAESKRSPELKAALAAWTTTRADAATQLAKLAAAIKNSAHPKAGEGLALIGNAINKQLTKQPNTKQQVDELLKYVGNDDIFTDAEKPNPFGFTVKIREPLLAAIGELQKHIA